MEIFIPSMFHLFLLQHIFFISETNQCSPNPCKNGGTCTDRNGKYECTCTIGFKGLTCEGRAIHTSRSAPSKQLFMFKIVQNLEIYKYAFL